MAYFAQIVDSTVARVVSVPDTQEARGNQFLSQDLGLGGVWVQTSYNTRGGVHYSPQTGRPSADQSKAFRYNYAGLGFTYDPTFGPDGAFIPPQPFPSWTLNPDTALWDAPTPMPETEGMWTWDEATLSWFDVSNP